jgi:molybdenum cofactor cytidylyltransferase
MLIEADGSRQKPLKGWANHEPQIPDFSDLVVQVAGMSGIGKPLTEENIHRAELLSELSGLEIGVRVTSEALAKVLTHPKGGLKNLPQSARRVALLNQADDADRQSSAQTMAESLLKVYDSVIVASLEEKKIHAVHEPLAGIILAAGESRRFGTPKQLLEWKGQPFVRVVAQTALDAGLSPVVLVTGSSASQVEQASGGLDLQIVRNDEWKDGQASSIKMGISSLPSNCGGAIFLLVDQPQLSTSIIHALKEKHAEGLHPVIAPMILDRRGNPVLFDRETFTDLLELEGDVGGRAIFHKHRVEYLPWHDDSLLLDVDTPEQYQRLLALEDL